MPNFDKKKILAKPLERSTAILTRADLNVDEENRTVELSFASDAPIYHWFGYLILDHSPSIIICLPSFPTSGSML
jgi:hypothetical protein